MNILIVEDEYLIADMIGIILKRNGYSRFSHAETLGQAIALLDTPPDVCLVDIRLKAENGIDFAKLLQEKEIPFLFITANNELETIKAAALTNPQAYLTKPINDRDLIAALEIIRARFPKYLWVRTSIGKIKIRQSEILYIEADNVYAKVVCESRTYMERITLKEVEELLEPWFIRVHRSFIVNRNKVASFKSNELRIGDYKIPVSKKYQDLILRS